MPHACVGLFYEREKMKQLTDADIVNMVGDEYTQKTDDAKSVRAELHLSRRIPKPVFVPEHTVLDFHQHTEEQAWNMIMSVAQSGSHTATVITGASGILKIKFQQWVRDSLLTQYIVSCEPVNNGSFYVKFKKKHN